MQQQSTAIINPKYNYSLKYL